MLAATTTRGKSGGETKHEKVKKTTKYEGIVRTWCTFLFVEKEQQSHIQLSFDILP